MNFIDSEINKQFPLSSEEIKLISEIGFMAASLGLSEQSKGIFKGLENIRGKSAFIYIGKALSHMLIGEWNEALYILREEGLRVIPESNELKLYLALTLIASNNYFFGEKILSNILNNADLSVEELTLASKIKLNVDANLIINTKPVHPENLLQD